VDSTTNEFPSIAFFTSSVLGLSDRSDTIGGYHPAPWPVTTGVRLERYRSVLSVWPSSTG